MNRRHQVSNYLMKSARYIVNYGLTPEPGALVVGSNPDWKRDLNLGKRTHQNLGVLKY